MEKSRRTSLFIVPEAQAVINEAPGRSQANKINGIIIRYGKIIEQRPDLAISGEEAVNDRIKQALA